MAIEIGSVLPGLGRALGTGIAQPIEQGLDLLAKKKLGELQRRNQMEAIKPAFKPEYGHLAGLASVIPPEKLPAFLELLDKSVYAQPQAAQEGGNIESLLQEAGQEEQPAQMGRPRTPSVYELLQSQASGQPISMQQLFAPQPGQPQEVQPSRQAAQPQIQPPAREPVDIFGGKREKTSQQEQKIINQTNAPYLNQLVKQVKLEEKLNRTAKDALKLIESVEKNDEERTASGYEGLLPLAMQNRATQELASKYATIASQLLQGTGVLSAAKINFAERMKSALWQDADAQKNLLKGFIEETGETLTKNDIRDALIRENNNKQPANIEGEINERYRLLQMLPPGTPNGTKFVDDEEPGIVYILKKGIPVKVR